MGETSKALGAHTESFVVPGQLQPGWHTLRWNWIAPGPVQFVHCIDIQINGLGMPMTPAPMPSPTPLVPLPLPAPMPLPPSPQPSGICVPEMDCSKNTLCTLDWTAFCSGLALANSCSGPYCRSGDSLLSPAAQVVPAERHRALAVDWRGQRLRASSSSRRSRVMAQTALI